MSVIYKPIRVLPPPIKPEDLGKSVQHISLVESDELPEGFYYTDGHPYCHPGYKYAPCVANPALPSILYTHSEPIDGKAGPNLADRNDKIGVSKDGVLTSPLGYRSCRANVAIGAGDWYFEVKIIKSNEQTNDAHVRIGIARREFSVQTPVGSDAYSYGLTDKGKKVHVSRPSEFMPSGFKSGDVIGFHVCIPRKPPHRVPFLVRRDRFPIKFRGRLYHETLDYVPTKDLNELLTPKVGIDLEPKGKAAIQDSFIKVYKNGELQGTMYENLREFLPPYSKFQKSHRLLDCNDGMAGYYPTISLYKGGRAQWVMGPDFEYAKPESARPLSEMWTNQIADEIVYDIVDQIHYETVDPLDPTKTQGEMPEWDNNFTVAGKTGGSRSGMKTGTAKEEEEEYEPGSDGKRLKVEQPIPHSFDQIPATLPESLQGPTESVPQSSVSQSLPSTHAVSNTSSQPVFEAKQEVKEEAKHEN